MEHVLVAGRMRMIFATIAIIDLLQFGRTQVGGDGGHDICVLPNLWNYLRSELHSRHSQDCGNVTKDSSI